MLAENDSRAVRHEATKARILKAAWRLARREGLNGFSLRDVAKAVGMRAPSLYSYFDSKSALYDAMFAQGYAEFAAVIDAGLGEDFEATFRESARRMFAFGASDPTRYQLLFQRTIPGFEPSDDAYGVSVASFDRARAWFARAGLDDRALDLWTCISTGLVSQQLANDPGGDRYERLVDDAVDMFLQYARYRKGKGKR